MTMELERHRRRLVSAAVAVLLAGIGALVLPPPASQQVTWEALLAPYSQGAPLPDGLRIDGIWRGLQQEVVISARRPGEAEGVEVHVMPRGRWTGIRESQSFGIGYETPRSPAPQREAVTEALAQAIRVLDHGLPAPADIPLGTAFVLGDVPEWPAMLRGWRGALLASSVALLAGLALRRSPGLALGGLAIGGVALLARLTGLGFGPAELSPAGGPADVLDLGVRAQQLAWLLLLASSPLLCWRGGRAVGVRGGRLLLAVSLAAVIALAAAWSRDDAPLHANGHAWREAREVLLPWGARGNGAAPFLHGGSGIALQWLLASAERSLIGTANPLDISRVGLAAAAAATAFLTAVLVRSVLAGLAAGCVLALMPLAQMLAVSGSALAIAAWLLPWSLGLLLAAARSGAPGLLAGAVLAAGLGTLSHTAMLAWPPALVAAWLVAAPRPSRLRRGALGGLLLLGLAWALELHHTSAMIASRSDGPGVRLLREAWRGAAHRNLLSDPQWVSPLLLPLLLAWLLAALRRERTAVVAASGLALLLAAAPFFAVTACSSDAVRYQGALLGLVTACAVAGAWTLPWPQRLSGAPLAVWRAALLAGLVVLPLPARQPPADPAAVEHRLVEEAARRLPPHTLIVLPPNRFEQGNVISDFPDFLLPADASLAFAGDPAIEAHVGPRLLYLGLACISYDRLADAAAGELRAECQALRANTQPWLVRTLRRQDLPRTRDGDIWTFHQLATDVPFGFFAPQ